MPRPKPLYPHEFCARIVELARAGDRTIRSIAQEFGVTDTTIRNWVRQADLDQGRRHDGLTSDEKAELTRLRRENRTLREERDILSKAAAWFAQGGRADVQEAFRFVTANRANHPVAKLCQVLDVSESGYHAWRTRPASKRQLEDAVLLDEIRAIHQHSRGTYRAPRIHAELQAMDRRIGRKRVARLMKAAGLAGVSRRRWCTTTQADGSPPAPDLVDRGLHRRGPRPALGGGHHLRADLGRLPVPRRSG